jgi:hypothetical protein
MAQAFADIIFRGRSIVGMSTDLTFFRKSARRDKTVNAIYTVSQYRIMWSCSPAANDVRGGFTGNISTPSPHTCI